MERKNIQKADDFKGRKQAAMVEEVKDDGQAAAVSDQPRQGESQISQVEERIEDSKFFMGQQTWPMAPSPRELPTGYGDNRIVLMVVDSWWAHSYWEVTSDRVQEGLRFLGCSLDQTKSMLRVYDVTGLEGTDRSNQFFDVELKGLANNWYVHCNGPDRSYRVDIGLLAQDGRFFTLARSNTITMPRSGMSDVVDERWMSLEYEKLYALSGGFRLGAGSLELKELMERRFHEALFSGAVSSFGGSPVKKKDRTFWFVLDAELIVYGATEPDAQVTVGGRPIQLRPDGTFTLRYALPDGRFPIPATARSSDGKEERTITPIVERNTEVSQPVLKI